MFTDIVGYTALMGKDEEKALSLLKINRGIQKPIIEKYQGKWLKELGDGVLAQFSSAYDAVKCAIEIQQKAGEELGGKLRIGIHLGDVTNDQNDVFGDGVNLASRIQGIADPGGIYLTESIENAIRNRTEIKTVYLGEAELKNVDYPVKIFAVQGEGFPVPSFKPRRRKSRKMQIILALALITILAIGGWYIFNQSPGSSLDAIRSLAVLPIVNLTGSDEQQYIVEGIHDALISELSHISSLRVISRTSAMKYANSNKPVPQIGKELNVDAVVESSVMRADDSIRLNVQLIRINPEEDHVWTGLFDQNLKEILTMVSNVTQEIAKSISIVLSPEEVELIRSEHVQPEIYKLYLRGKYHLDKHNPEDFAKGTILLNDVIAKDPTYALAYATLSLAYGDLAHLPSAPQDAFPRAKALAMKALEMDDMLVEAHTAMAEARLYYDWHFKSAENSFKKVMAIDSNFAPALSNYGWLMDILDRKTEAERYLRKAADLDPLVPIYRAWLAWWYWGEKRYDEAIAEAKRIIEISPDFPMANMVLGSVYVETGRIDEGIALTKKAADADERLLWALGKAYANSVKHDEAQALVDKIEKTPHNAFTLLIIYADLGDIENAMKWAKVVYDIHHIFTPWLTKLYFAGKIKDEPRLKSILAPIHDSLAIAVRQDLILP